MSSAKPKLEREGGRSAGRPTASLARSITWGFWWRKVLGVLCADVFAILVLGVVFTWHCASTLPASALDGIEYTIGGWLRFLALDSWGFSGDGSNVASWTYNIFGADGVTYRFPVIGYLQTVMPFLLFAGCCQILDCFDVFSDTRRVRRKLQPLNDLAVMADRLGVAGVADPMVPSDSDDKMATLEQAIQRASVDSPTVSTGDQDLRSIEVALNGLLRQMQEAKLQQMRFVSDASHELRTPIAVIQGYVNMLDRWGSSDEEVLHESIEALKAESEHMQELVEQLLFLARGDSGRNTLQRIELNVADMVLEVWDESCMIDEGHEYVCTLTDAEAGDQRFAVTGDLAMLKQALRIIVQNAEKYSPEGATITLGATASPSEVAFSVQDEGIGMSEQDAAHAFERFYRGEGARADGAQGSGLGLSIAKWIVDAHGGTIEVLSREGVGTRITIHLPR